MKHLTDKEKLRELGLSSLDKRRPTADLTNMCKCLIGRSKRRVRLFAGASSDWTRGNVPKWKYRNLHLNIRTDLCSMREIKTLEQVAQRPSGVSAFGDA